MNLPTKNSITMKLPKIIAILAGTIVGTEIVMFLVHQLLMGYPYSLNFLSIPAFFAAFEALFCIMGYKSLMHSKNTRFFMAFKTGARVTVTISENGTLSHKEPTNTDKTEK